MSSLCDSGAMSLGRTSTVVLMSPEALRGRVM